jgi:hypothetical protein
VAAFGVIMQNLAAREGKQKKRKNAGATRVDDDVNAPFAYIIAGSSLFALGVVRTCRH